MGSKLLNGSTQLSVSVIFFLLIAVTNFTSETIAGTPIINMYIAVN